MKDMEPEEFARWAQQWLESRTWEYWVAFAERVNKGRPRDEWFEPPVSAPAMPVRAVSAYGLGLQPVEVSVQSVDYDSSCDLQSILPPWSVDVLDVRSGWGGDVLCAEVWNELSIVSKATLSQAA